MEGRLKYQYSLNHLVFCLPYTLPRPHLIVVVVDDSGCVGGFLTAVTLTAGLLGHNESESESGTR